MGRWPDPSSRSHSAAAGGGGERIRTDGLLRARQALSQLSYTPVRGLFPAWWAWMDLNHRPHAYQACALTKLSYRPPAVQGREKGKPSPAGWSGGASYDNPPEPFLIDAIISQSMT